MSLLLLFIFYHLIFSFLTQYQTSYNAPYTFLEERGKEVVDIIEELPFEIPESWEWVRLINICTKLVDGDHNPPKGASTKTDYIMASSTNINNDSLVELEKVRYLTKEVFEKENLRTNATTGDIFLTTVGSLGRSCIFDGTHNICFQRSVSIIATLIFNKYLKYFFDSGLFQNKIVSEASGTAQKGFYLNQLAVTLIPIPPIDEQYRIVEEIEKYIPLIHEYNSKKNRLDKLQESFPERLKKSILQEAIQGKLVPQDPNDEPASVLLERIRAEKEELIKQGKIKKDKNESIIFRRDNSYYEKRGTNEHCIDEELPYEIPASWCWSKLGTCMDVRDGTHDTPKYVDCGVPLVTSKNLYNGKIDFSTAKLISKEDSVAINQRSKVDDGDILFAMIGSIGNPVLYYGSDDFSIKNMALFKKIPGGMDMEYVYWFLVLIQDEMKKSASGGVQAFVSLGFLRNFLIPVPPDSEQKRICKAIRQILPLLAAL